MDASEQASKCVVERESVPPTNDNARDSRTDTQTYRQTYGHGPADSHRHVQIVDPRNTLILRRRLQNFVFVRAPPSAAFSFGDPCHDPTPARNAICVHVPTNSIAIRRPHVYRSLMLLYFWYQFFERQLYALNNQLPYSAASISSSLHAQRQ